MINNGLDSKPRLFGERQLHLPYNSSTVWLSASASDDGKLTDPSKTSNTIRVFLPNKQRTVREHSSHAAVHHLCEICYRSCAHHIDSERSSVMKTLFSNFILVFVGRTFFS